MQDRTESYNEESQRKLLLLSSILGMDTKNFSEQMGMHPKNMANFMSGRKVMLPCMFELLCHKNNLDFEDLEKIASKVVTLKEAQLNFVEKQIKLYEEKRASLQKPSDSH